MSNQVLKYRLVSMLLAKMEAEGSAFGTRQHLTIQQLLQKVPDNIAPEELKTLLVPILAQTPSEQHQLYQLFEECMEQVLTMDQEESAPTSPGVDPSNTYWRLLLALLFLLALALIGLWFTLTGKPGPKEYFHSISVAERDSIFYEFLLERREKVLDVSFLNRQKMGIDSFFGRYELVGRDTIFYKANEIKGDSLSELKLLVNYGYVTDVYNFMISIVPETPDTSKIAQIQDPIVSIDSVQRARQDSMLSGKREHQILDLSIPHPHNLADYQFDPQKNLLARIWKDYGWLIKTFLAFVFALILWVYIRYTAKKKAKIVAELGNNGKAPYIWQIAFKSPIAFSLNETVENTINQLRQRQKSDTQILDLKSTIHTTIQKGGQIDFQYLVQTRPPEYLVLIDRQSANDHRAQLFDQLYQVFKANEIYAERFYYDGDPRLCFNEIFPYGVSLKELQHKYELSRLLLIGNGYHLLSPISNKLSKWTSIFNGWQEKVLLTTLPAQSWTRKEANLSSIFTMAPATMSGLGLAIDQLQVEENTDFLDLLKSVRNQEKAPVRLNGDLINSLKTHFPEALIEWMAVCSIYPSLQWELTLQLGQIVANRREETDLISLENLESLFRVPWFISGAIPDAARQGLIEYLQDNDLEQYYRQAIHELLNEARSPDPESTAFEDYQMNIISNQIMFEKNQSKRQALEQKFKEYLEAGYEPDYITFRYLNQTTRPLGFLVPESWRPHIYPEGQPVLGLKPWLWVIPLWAVLTTCLFLFLKPAAPVCEGEPRTYNNMQLCIDAPAKAIIFLEQTIIDEIFSGNINAYDSTINIPANRVLLRNDSIQRDTFEKNIAAAYYIKGAQLFNQNLDQVDEITKTLIDSFRNEACAYFAKANELVPNHPDYQREVNICNGESPGQYAPRFMWCLDNAKLRTSPTFVSPLFRDKSGRLYEYQFTREIISLLAERLAYQGVQHFKVMPEEMAEKQDIRLRQQRIDGLSTSLDKFVISINLTSFSGKTSTRWNNPNIGIKNSVESWYTTANENSNKLADVLQRQLIISTGFNNRQVNRIRSSIQYPILNGLEVPAVAVGIGMADIEEGAINLMQDSTKQKIADAIFDAIYEIERLGLDLANGDWESATGFIPGEFTERGIATDNSSPTDYDETSIPPKFPGQVRTRKIPGGSFIMGCQNQEGDCEADQLPAHSVRISSDIEMGQYEVTNEEFARFLNGKDENRLNNQQSWYDLSGELAKIFRDNQGYFRVRQGFERHPVTHVSIRGAQAYCEWLSVSKGNQYRLPSESEWEYAAKGGRDLIGTQAYSTYSGSNNLNEVGWYERNSGNRIHSIGQKAPNALNIYDMSGNVAEWVADCMSDNYSGAPTDGSVRFEDDLTICSSNVVRGGAFDLYDYNCSNIFRNNFSRLNAYPNVGFRVVLEK